MIVFIFEDNEKTPSSLLLSSSYFSKHNKVLFAKSARYVRGTLQANYDSQNTYIIFCDVVPNEIETRKFYRYLRRYIDTNKYDNVILMPIVCMEYIICKMLLNFGYLVDTDKSKRLTDNLVRDFTWDKLSEDEKELSLEELYKRILARQKYSCMNNKQKHGEFYKQDCGSSCSCCDKVCKGKYSDSLDCKAERLYGSLPIFMIVDDVHKSSLSYFRVPYVHKSIDEIKSDIQDTYNVMCDSIGCPQLNV